jgi:hypothetical protein
MSEEPPVPSSRQHRSPAEISAHCVRLSYRFPLSDRDGEEFMFERGSSSRTRPSAAGATSSARSSRRPCGAVGQS